MSPWGVLYTTQVPARQLRGKPASVLLSALHRGAFCQFPFRWIYYCHSSKSTEKETGKKHLCALQCLEYKLVIFDSPVACVCELRN